MKSVPFDFGMRMGVRSEARIHHRATERTEKSRATTKLFFSVSTVASWLLRVKRCRIKKVSGTDMDLVPDTLIFPGLGVKQGCYNRRRRSATRPTPAKLKPASSTVLGSGIVEMVSTTI